MKKCEACGLDHDGNFSSGRFCSLKCSRSFSTKEKRKEINAKISAANTGTGNKPVEKICKNCQQSYLSPWKRRHGSFCSRSCSAKFHNSKEETRSNLSDHRIKAIQRGVINGKGQRSVYMFNGIEIKCDSKIERACLDYFEKKGATSMKRCPYIIEYVDEGVTRKFLPDFEIVLGEKVYVVEAKSYISIKSLNKKWRDYNRKSELKKLALQAFCEMNGYESFWFTKDMNLKFYLKE